MKKTSLLILALVVFLPAFASAHQPRLIYRTQGDIQVKNPELSQAFYDELPGQARNYLINSDKNFVLYLNLLVPEGENRNGRYSADVFLLGNGKEEKIASIDGLAQEWKEYYEEYGRDYYLKGPELEKELAAGNYKISVFSADNKGKYVLALGKTESYDLNSLLNVYWQLPLLKMEFFKSPVLQFFLTPFGIGAAAALGALLVFLAIVYFLIGLLVDAIRHSKAKTIFLASSALQVKDQILKLLQKPAYNTNVAFISTAAKPLEDVSFVKQDWDGLMEIGFNLEEVDIEGKTESQLLNLLSLKDIIFVEGGNTFYLLKAMRKCHFEKVMRKLMKKGIVYIGSSAGAMVAGKTIKTATWKHPVETFGVKNTKGLNFVPFDIFVHYKPEHADLIKEKMKFRWRRNLKLRILTDEQAIIREGRQIVMIGEGQRIIV